MSPWPTNNESRTTRRIHHGCILDSGKIPPLRLLPAVYYLVWGDGSVDIITQTRTHTHTRARARARGVNISISTASCVLSHKTVSIRFPPVRMVSCICGPILLVKTIELESPNHKLKPSFVTRWARIVHLYLEGVPSLCPRSFLPLQPPIWNSFSIDH